MTVKADDLSLNENKQKLLKILNATSEGIGPDVVFLQNIENQEAFNNVLSNEFSHFGYKYFALSEENEDHKQSAILSRFAFEEEPSTSDNDVFQVLLSISPHKDLRVFLQPKDAIYGLLDELSEAPTGETYLVTGGDVPKLAVSKGAKFHKIALSAALKGVFPRPLIAEVIIP
jgi:hypothetical protein